MKYTPIIIIVIFLVFPLSGWADDKCLQGDCMNGFGIMQYSTGHRFEGHFKDGLRHGEGVMYMPGQRKLIGVWKNNRIREGTYILSDGSKYMGQWKHMERNGMGTLTYADGRKYEGEFRGGQKHGQGKMTYPDGRIYEGEFKYGERTGQGAMIYPDGRKYIGEFKSGKKTGLGTMIYPDGREVTGTFKDGVLVEE